MRSHECSEELLQALRCQAHVLNTALENYRPGQSELILFGGINLLKPALAIPTDF